MIVVVVGLGLSTRVVVVTKEAAGFWVGELVTDVVVGAVLAGEDGTNAAVVDAFGGKAVGPGAVAVGTVFTGESGTEEVVAMVVFLSEGEDG